MRGFSMRKHLWSTFGLLTMILFAFGSVGSNNSTGVSQSTDPKAEKPSERPSGVLRRGESGYIEVSGESMVWVSVNEKSLDELNAYSRQKNEAAIEEMMVQGRVLVCGRNTKVSVVDPGFMTTTVRIMDGKHAGKSGIIPNEFLHR